MNNRFGFGEFLKRYKTDEDCLEEIKSLLFPHGIYCKECKKVTKHFKVKKRLAYSCEFCGSHIYPLAYTVMKDTKISLRFWFYAIFIMTQTRAGVSAKTLQRELGVSYPTAFRMFHQVRKAMKEEGIILKDKVEADESYWSGDGKFRKYVPYFSDAPKQIIMGFLERDGRVVTQNIPDTSKMTMLDNVKKYVSLEAKIYTDQHPNYKYLSKLGYEHDFVVHRREYVKKTNRDVYTQGIESYWSQLKRGLRGVYRRPSKKYFQNYLDEYSWRFNHRNEDMFPALLQKIATPKLSEK